jgi:hypothetical protein
MQTRSKRPKESGPDSLNQGASRARTFKLLGFRSCFSQALGVHLENGELGVFKYL